MKYEVEVTDEEMEFIELLRNASDKDKKDVEEYLEENSLKETWHGKVH